MTRTSHRPVHTAAASTFVGRDVELDRLIAAVSEPGSLVLIDGDAGMGKTRLLAECLDRPELAGLRVVTLECLPSTDPFPLGPVVEMLHGQPLGELDLSPLAGALRPLLAEWSDDLPPAPDQLDDPQAVLFRVLRAVVEVITKLAVDLVVVEDVHWADQATLELLLMLTTRPPSGLRVALTYRPREVPRDSLLLRMSSRSTHRMKQTRVSLEPLDVPAARSMVAAMFTTQDVSASFAEFLHQRTDGVPLALQETLALLLDRGDIVRRGDEWARRAVEEMDVPPTVRDSVIERTGRLSAGTQRLLQAAAVLAEPSDEALLGEVAELDAHPAQSALRQALASGLLVERRPGRFQFRHVLAAEAVDEATPEFERRRLHGRAADAVQRAAPSQLARLCRHFRGAGDITAWSIHAEAAADRALETGDDRSAVALLLELLAHPAHPHDRQTVIAKKMAHAATWGVGGLGELGERVVTALRAVLDDRTSATTELGEIRSLLGRLLLQLGEFDAAAEHTERALAAFSDRPQSAARAMMSLAWPRGGDWPVHRHLEYCKRAAALLPDVTDPADRLVLEVDRDSVLLMLGDQSPWDAPQRLAARATTVLEQRQVARLLMNTGHVGIAWGRDAAARQRLADAERIMAQTGYRRLVNSARLTTAHLDWLDGRWDGLAERTRALAEADETLPEARLEARGTLAMLEAVSGDRDRARQELSAVVDEMRRRGVCDGHLASAAALVTLDLGSDRIDDALAVTSVALATAQSKSMWLWAGGLVIAGIDAQVAADRLDDAGDLLARFTAGLSGTSGVPGPETSVLVGRGTVAFAHGDLAGAAAAFTAAAEGWARLPRPYSELCALERLARVELAAGETVAALDRLQSVERRLRELGAAHDADRVAGVLRQNGVDVVRVWRGGRRGYGTQLSPREDEVARLVTRGLTNRQVAQQLYLSPRTVDRHLSSAMRKLGVSSRTALAVAFSGSRSDGAAT